MLQHDQLTGGARFHGGPWLHGNVCAYAMGAKGEKVSVDPETFKIVDGKLFLFYNRFFTNTLKDWNKDESNLKTLADRNWKNLITKP